MACAWRATGFSRAVLAFGLLVAGCSPAAAVAPTAAPSNSSSPGASASPVLPGGAPSALALPAPAPSASASLAPAASPAPSAAAASSGGVTNLNIAYGSTAGSFAALWMAQTSGAFAAHNLNVSLSLLAADTGVAALIAGDVDAIELSAAPILTADANGGGGANLVFIGSGLDHPIFSLMVSHNVQSAADVKGKTIASDKPGTPIDYGTHQLLSLLGVSPSDVSLLPLGTPGTVTALVSGQSDAATLAPPDTFTVENQGFTELVNDYDQPYQNVGIAVRRDRIAALRPALINLLAAYRDGIAAYNDNPSLAVQTFQKYSSGDPSILQLTYNFYKDQAPFEQDLQPTMAGTQAMIDFLSSSTVPALQGAQASQFWDTSLLSELPPPQQ